MKTKQYEVELSAVPNIDYMGRTHNGTVKIKPSKVVVSSFKEASNVVGKFINDNRLGGGNWSGGQIYENNIQVAYISYNGRVWKGIEGKNKSEEIIID